MSKRGRYSSCYTSRNHAGRRVLLSNVLWLHFTDCKYRFARNRMDYSCQCQHLYCSELEHRHAFGYWWRHQTPIIILTIGVMVRQVRSYTRLQISTAKKRMECLSRLSGQMALLSAETTFQCRQSRFQAYMPQVLTSFALQLVQARFIQPS